MWPVLVASLLNALLVPLTLTSILLTNVPVSSLSTQLAILTVSHAEVPLPPTAFLVTKASISLPTLVNVSCS